MMSNLYKKRNNSPVSCYYPIGGNKNVLRKISGVKLRSGTGPSGRFITVEEKDGQIRSLSVNKCVASL